MSESASQYIGELLTGTVEHLDIPHAHQAAAVELYDDVSKWLSNELPEHHDWHIYPQGSMRLGTVVRPLGKDEYDIDAVAQCAIDKESITRKDFKALVGEALQSYIDEHLNDDTKPSKCEAGRRCWTLVFPDGTPLHMDVLPAVPNHEAGSPAIWITDRDLVRWQPSNPIGFADWFRLQAAVDTERQVLAKRFNVAIDDVPMWQVRTQLQRVVQVLKAHRNIHFAASLELRPPSVILTTLAARSFRPKPTLFDAVMETVERMPTYLTEEDGLYVVRNPSHKDENFADRWGADPKRPAMFFEWLDGLKSTLDNAARTRGGQDHLVERLGAEFGLDAVQKSAAAMATRRTTSRNTSGLIISSTGIVGARSGLSSRPHTFHGA